MSEGTDAAAFMRSRDSARFDELYRRHYRPIRDFCRRRVGSDRIDDAVADTFLAAWRRIDDVPNGDEALLWLYAVAYRVIGHQWRSASRYRRLEDRLRSVAHRAVPAADESIGDDDEHRLVLQAAARLGEADAEVLRLTAWEQLSVADIATVLQIAPNAVKQRLHRARQHLGREYRRLATLQLSTPIAPTGGAR